ncbi:uncharacterized protein LOC143815710 isoform X2 [Ranitomeya variabilis]
MSQGSGSSVGKKARKRSGGKGNHKSGGRHHDRRKSPADSRSLSLSITPASLPVRRKNNVHTVSCYHGGDHFACLELLHGGHLGFVHRGWIWINNPESQPVQQQGRRSGVVWM